MKVHLFSIPAFDGEESLVALNAFLATHAIQDLDRRFVDAGLSSHWLFCVTTVERGEPRPMPLPRGSRPRTDYREVLSAEDFRVFAALRTCRKQLAESAGVPVYQVASNDQLAEIVKRDVRSKAALSEIAGFGQTRVSTYGDALLAAYATSRAGGEGLNAATDEVESDASDAG